MRVQANVEYFFRLLYDLFHGFGGVNYTALEATAARIWIWIAIIGYIIAALSFALIVYLLVRMFELREREEEYYRTLLPAPEGAGKNARWEHVKTLAGGTNPSEWREAILEADIMLDEFLTRRGAPGATVAEKLRTLDQADFRSLRDAWEAHRVRNQIAHEGSDFALSDSLTQRTIAHYEAAFREFGVI